MDVIVQLLECERFGDADARFHDDRPLRLAAENGHSHVVQLLVEKYGADAHIRDEECLRVAAENGHSHVAQLLVDKYGADIHIRKEEPLRLASANGHCHVVQLLVEKYGHRVDIHTCDDAPLRLRKAFPKWSIQKPSCDAC